MTDIDGYSIVEDENGFGRTLVLKGRWRSELTQFMLSHGLTVLRLSDSAGWTDNDVSFVAGLDFLAGLEVFNWNVKDVSPIFVNGGLKYVGIQCDFKSIADFRQLKRLEVCKIFWKPGIVGLEQCVNLRELNLVNYSGTDLTALVMLRELARLDVSSRSLVSLAGIDSLPRLSTFDAANCTRLRDISCLVNCSVLQSLRFSSCKRISEFPSDLRLSQLKEVSLIDCGKFRSLTPLSKCSRLVKLSFVGDTFVVDGNLDFLLTHPSIREVRFANRSHYSITREEMAATLAARGQP